MTKTFNIFGFVFKVAALILLLDAAALMLWVMSGQHPVDGFYFGAITANIIGLFI